MARKVVPIKHKMIEMSEGVRIGSGFNLKPAPYLPIIEADTEKDLGIVIKRGTIVTFDDNGYLIPCVGGSAVKPSYTALDVTYGVTNIDDSEVVEATDIGAATTAYAKNAPVGVAQYDIYQFSPDDQYTYQIQPHVAVLQDYFVLYALNASQGSADWVPGAVVVPDNTGYPTPASLAFFGNATIEDEDLTFGAVSGGESTVTLAKAPAPSTLELSVVISTVTYSGTDDGEGVVTLVDEAGTEDNVVGTVNYVSGVITLTTETKPTDGSNTATYNHANTYNVQQDILDLEKFKVGRVVRKVDLSNDVDKDFMGGYDQVKVVPGLGLNDGEVTGIDKDSGLGVLIQLQF